MNFLIYTLKWKVHIIIEGVCRSSRHGFSDIAKQEEVREKENLEKVVGTVKGAEFIVNSIKDKMIATLVYSLKLVYFLSPSCKTLNS